MGHELKRRLSSAVFGGRADSGDAALDAVKQLHIEYIESGATVITTSSFLATRRGVVMGGLEETSVRWAVRSACEAAAAAVDACGARASSVRIAGCVPPLGTCYVAPSDSDGADAAAQYRDIISALLEPPSRVSILLLETLSTSGQAVDAIRAAQAVIGRQHVDAEASGEGDTLELWVSFTLDDGEEALLGSSCELRGGESLEDAVAAVRAAAADGAGWGRMGLLVNCCHPSIAERAVKLLRRIIGATTGEGPANTLDRLILVGAYANAFANTTGQWLRGRGCGEPGVLTVEEFSRHACTLRDAGAEIVGGCCGTTPSMMREAYRAVVSTEPSAGRPQ